MGVDFLEMVITLLVVSPFGLQQSASLKRKDQIGAGHKASHNIYIWDRASGGLMKILEGPKDPLEDIDVSFTEARSGREAEY